MCVSAESAKAPIVVLSEARVAVIRLPSERAVALSAALGSFSFIAIVHGTIGLALGKLGYQCATKMLLEPLGAATEDVLRGTATTVMTEESNASLETSGIHDYLQEGKVIGTRPKAGAT